MNPPPRQALVIATIPWLFASGCMGPSGDPGTPGTDGQPGTTGLACWDLNENGNCEPTLEDTNQDGVCDVLDCRAQGTGGAGAGGSGGNGGAAGAAGGGTSLYAGYVGTAVCAECHAEIYEKFSLSGHGYAMSAVSGANAPTRPFDATTGGIPPPPLGLAWSDVSYVVGGFGWKVNYVNSDGYLVTGAAGDQTQYDFANDALGSSGQWADYHAGEQRPYDCGSCHNTGWIPCEVGDDACPHQDEAAGMAGSFFATGVQCEACHGPGQQHASSPYLNSPIIDRTAAACGKCHRRADVERIDAADGFVRHNQQYDELFSSKKHVMQCIDCHDPHQSSKFAEPTVNPQHGLRISCLTCHVGYDQNQQSIIMQALLSCLDCHMPPSVASAASDAGTFRGDMRSHIFAINPAKTAEQFYPDTGGASYSNPFLTLNYSCNHCHGVTSTHKTIDELATEASHYHQ